ncbi:MAG TPA: SDR family oxidoreductase [Ilumatobacteraceae bacterium]|jgi:NAD(P)-dependent dehydrogenase (short-subunit alcohol dehydrogenase family)|nr:SDR family oxidoreductase [Ilumatobacteraceae bacterium]
MEDLDGLRALVTGGGSGIGAAIAARLRQAGAEVLVVDMNPATSPDVVADVADTGAVDDVFSEVVERLGGLDVLVNNVGVAGPTAGVDSMDPEAFDECVRINLGSMFRCTRLAVPLLRERPGSITNISSSAGLFGYPLRSPYAAAKWAVIGLTKTWAMELGSDGIRVNAICPGSVGGPRMDGVIEREAAALGVAESSIRSAYESQVSMGSFVDAGDIAEAVAFLSSPAARYISGQVLGVDGHTETLRTNCSHS